MDVTWYKVLDLTEQIVRISPVAWDGQGNPPGVVVTLYPEADLLLTGEWPLTIPRQYVQRRITPGPRATSGLGEGPANQPSTSFPPSLYSPKYYGPDKTL